MNQGPVIELHPSGKGETFEFRPRSAPSRKLFSGRLKFWVLAGLGTVLGAVLLFFLFTFFLYILIPLFLIASFSGSAQHMFRKRR